MKTKKLSKKLSLNKKTIAHLNNNEMSTLNGGKTSTLYPENCETFFADCSARTCFQYTCPGFTCPATVYECETIPECTNYPIGCM